MPTTTPNHAAEYQQTGSITSLDYLFDPEACSPLTQPDNPFDFAGLFEDPERLPSVGDKAGTEVAVIGAGCAGMAAANILLRAGLRPVVYELSGRIGGRTDSRRFSRDPAAFAELGAMRIPTSQSLIFRLAERWGIAWHTFPNPLVVDTVIDVYGQQVFYDASTQSYSGPAELVARIKQVQKLYELLIAPINATWNATQGDLNAREAAWKNFVQIYNNKSFFQVLVESGWTREQINLFGSIGIGSGGFDSFFGSSFLEIVRIAIQELEVHQQLIVGGTEQFPQRLWSEEVDAQHWGQTSVRALNDDTTRPGVAKLRPNGPGGRITVVDINGQESSYEAVVLTPSPRAIDMTLDIPQDAFSLDVWDALRSLELVASEKVFILTRTAFWKQPEYRLYTTLTDRPPRQMYLFDGSAFGSDTPAGVIALSYSWAASSIKFDSLTNEQRVAVCLDAIENMAIYGPEMRRKIEEEMVESVSITWEDEYGYNGGWRMANPGQAEAVHTLHMQTLGLPAEYDNGLYLAGEALSWYGLSGWIDGALKTGVQAALSAIRRIQRSGL